MRADLLATPRTATRRIASFLLSSWKVRNFLRATGTGLAHIADHMKSVADKAEFRVRHRNGIEWMECPGISGEGTAGRWVKLKPAEGFLTIIATTYRQSDALAIFLHSLRCQTISGFKVHVVHDGPDPATEDVLEDFSDEQNFHLRYTFTPERHNDWGHSLRSLALREVDSEFVMITNGDNYYIPRFVEFAHKAVTSHDLDMLHWDMVHSHDRPGGRPNRSYQPFTTAPMIHEIDIGAFLVRSSVATKVGFNSRAFDADGRYIEDLIGSGMIRRIGHLNKTIFVHN